VATAPPEVLPPVTPVLLAVRPRTTRLPVPRGPVSIMVTPGVKDARSLMSSRRWVSSVSEETAEMLIGTS